MRDVTRSQFVVGAGYAARLLLALGITAVVGRAASPEDFGFFVLVSSFFGVSYVALDLGTTSLAAREIARDPARESPLLEGLLAWRYGASAVLALLLLVWMFLETDGMRRVVLLFASAAVFVLAQGALAPVLQVRQAQGAPALARTLAQGLVLLGALALRAGSAAGAWFALLVPVRAVLGALGLRHAALRHLPERPRAGFTGRRLGPFFRAACVNGGAMLALALAFHIDVPLVRLLRGEAELGAYSAAFRLVNPLIALPHLLALPLVPALAAFAATDRARFVALVRRHTLLLTSLGAGGAVAAAILGARVLTLLYGERYTGELFDASPAVTWLAVALAAAFAGAAPRAALLASARERALLVIALLGLLLNTVLNVLLLPHYDFVAAAVTTAATEVFLALIPTVLAWNFERPA